ncbi:MAG: hypothetical protein QOG55_2291, partial [Acidobacteriaceae bacterium]|nr:hypothetical protein [Acidobacteriaceae bacterium]
VYASSDTSRYHLQDSRPGWIRCLLSCRALSSPTTCRFIPALSGLPTNQEPVGLPEPVRQTPEWFRSWKDPRPWYLLARVAGASDVDRVVAMLARARDAQRMGGTMWTTVDALIERLDNGISGGGLLGG